MRKLTEEQKKIRELDEKVAHAKIGLADAFQQLRLMETMLSDLQAQLVEAVRAYALATGVDLDAHQWRFDTKTMRFTNDE